MTTATTTYSRLTDVLVELGVEPDEIRPEANLRTDLEVDSAELVEIVTQVAPITVDGKALKAVRTIADLCTFLDELR